MRILFIRPPYLYPLNFTGAFFKSAPAVDVPLGLLYMAAVLEKNGIESRVFDCLVEGEDIFRPFSVREGCLHLGADYNRIRSHFAETAPDLVCITNSFSSQTPGVLRVAELAREILPECRIVVGGAHASSDPVSLFDLCPAMNYVIRGEGEYSMLELVRNLEQHGEYRGDNPAILTCDSVAAKSGLPIEFIANLDDLPLPAYHLVDLERYFHFDRIGYPARVKLDYPGSDRCISVITSRGCPYRCTFCSVRLHMGAKLRTHSVDYVVNHLRVLKERYGINHVHFEDDAVNVPSSRLNAVMQAMMDNRFDFTWDTPNGIRAEGIDDEMLGLARRSGCVYLLVGAESGDQDVLDKIVKKKLRTEDVVSAARRAKENEIDFGAFFIMGFPGETLANIKTTARFALDLNRRCHVALHMVMLTPIVGTELYEKAVRDRLLPEKFSRTDLLDYYFTVPALEYKNFTSSDLYDTYRMVERRFMLAALLDTMVFCLRHPLISARHVWFELKQVVLRRRSVAHLPRNLYLRHFLYPHAMVRLRDRGV